MEMKKLKDQKEKYKNDDLKIIEDLSKDKERELDRDIVEEEKSERAWIKRDIEEMRKSKMLEHE